MDFTEDLIAKSMQKKKKKGFGPWCAAMYNCIYITK